MTNLPPGTTTERYDAFGRLAPVTASLLTGRVVVVAGADDLLPALVSRLAAEGAFVAFVAATRTDDAHAAFRADPADPVTWERVAPHVEQRLGPVDAVVADAACRDVVAAVFLPDMRRRGHGGIHVIAPGEDVEDVLRSLAGMQ
jgi:NAD(P)-dependent dehydrogenase (short-subunit alcohol dehydrogenase family)